MSHNGQQLTDNIKKIRVAILAEEPIGWPSGKNFFQMILDGYTWTKDDLTFQISTDYLFDIDILNGKLTTKNFDVLLVPGGGVGDGEAIVKGLGNFGKTRIWKKNISDFIKNGGGYVGICGGTALITRLLTENGRPKTILGKLYDKSSLDVSSVVSYYKSIAFPLIYPFQLKYPQKVGAAAYVFSFAPGETVNGTRFFSGGVPIDFKIKKDNPIFSDFPYDSVRIRWWGGPALIVSDEHDREIKILATYPEKELSDDESTKIIAWKYKGGIRGFIFAIFKALKFIKENNEHLRSLPIFTYYFAGDWIQTKIPIELDYKNKAAMTLEIYPNENKGRIILTTAHPEYMIWRDGKIEEVEDTGFNCIANGFHKWNHVAPLSKDISVELTSTWWIVRRMVAWAAKISQKHMLPITKEKLTEENKEVLSSEIFWDGTASHQMSNI